MAEGGGDSLNSFNIPSDLMNMITDEAGFLPDFSIGESSLTGNGPNLEILEQPKQRGFRFRYSCEGPSHGGLPGERSVKGKKSYPSVQINGYVGPARIEVSLMTASDPPKPHAHSLVGKNVVEGACIIEIGQEQGMTASFPNLGVQHVTKKNVKTVLFERYMKSFKLHRATLIANGGTEQALDLQFGAASGSGNQDGLGRNIAETVASEETKKLEKLVDEEAKNMNLSTVRLCFQTYLPDKQGRFVKCLHPVYSNLIYDSKAAAASELKICRMDRQAGFVNGGEEVFLLCDKVQKEDIEVRFFDSINGKDWEDFGKFAPTDVHRQYAIVFKTPAYWNNAIERPVTVLVELRRKSDKETSNTMEFTYKPTEFDPEQIGAKRRKKVPHFGDYSDQGGSGGVGGGFGGAGAGAGGGGGGGAGGMGFNLSDPGLWNQLFSFMPSGSVGMGHQSQGQALPQDATPGDSAEDRSSSEKETKVPSMEIPSAVSQALRQTIVSAVSLEHFSRTNDLRHILAGQHSQSTTPNDDGDCALHIAIINGHSNIVNNLLAILSPSFVNQFNHLRQTPLHLAVITQQPKVIAKLLQAGADVTLQDRDGNTPLHLASKQSSPACLHSLVTRPSHGIFNQRDQKYPELNMPNYDGLTAVHLAVKCDQLENLKILHSIKANMNAQMQDGKGSFSPLHYAVDANNVTVAEYLIVTADVDIDIPTIDGNTPLHLSSGHGWVSITALLVAANADINAVNTENERAVDLATITEVIKVLECHDGTSRVTSVETKMEFDSMDDETSSKSTNDNLDMLRAFERCEFVSSLSKDWKSLAERLNLGFYVAGLELQKNPAKHLLDIYETLDGSALKLCDALVDLGNRNAAQIIKNSLASMDSFPALPKDSPLSHFSETDSDYGSLPIADEPLSSFQSLKENKKGPHSSLNPSGISAEQKKLIR